MGSLLDVGVLEAMMGSVLARRRTVEGAEQILEWETRPRRVLRRRG